MKRDKDFGNMEIWDAISGLDSRNCTVIRGHRMIDRILWHGDFFREMTDEIFQGEKRENFIKRFQSFSFFLLFFLEKKKNEFGSKKKKVSADDTMES